MSRCSFCWQNTRQVSGIAGSQHRFGVHDEIRSVGDLLPLPDHESGVGAAVFSASSGGTIDRIRIRRPARTLGAAAGRLCDTSRAVDADGKLDASYANPRPLPFHTAVASKDGNVLKLFFELRAGGYNGSTYTLRYDAANDRLTGIYDQVVVKQTFEVVFVRDTR